MTKRIPPRWVFALLLLPGSRTPKPEPRQAIPPGWILALLLPLVAASPGPVAADPADAPAASPAERLLRLVGPDVGICIEAPRLKDRVFELRNSPLLPRLAGLEPVRSWIDGRDGQKLRRACETIERLADKPIEALAADLFGEAVVLAVYPVAQDETAGILLTETAGADVLQAALAVWNRAEPQQTEQLAHRGQPYFRRTRLARGERPAETVYYMTRGRLLGLSDREAMIHKVIELHQAGDGDEPAGLAGSAAYQAAKSALSADPWLTVYFNPQAWTPYLGVHGVPGRLPEELWRRWQALAIGVHVEQGLVLELVAHYDSSDVPPLWRDFLERTQGSAAFVNRAPAGALAAMAGRFDWSLVDKLLDRRIPAARRESWDRARQVGRGVFLGLDVFEDVLPALKPDWGFYLVARSAADDRAFPVEGVLAWRLPEPASAAPVPISPDRDESDRVETLTHRQGPAASQFRPALDNALHMGWNLLAAAHNGRNPSAAARVQSQPTARGPVRWVENLGSYEPAYVLAADYLVLASRRQLLTEFLLGREERSLARSPRFQQAQQRWFPAASQVLFVDVAQLRQLLRDHRGPLLQRAAQSSTAGDDGAGRKLQRLDELLQIFDAGFLALTLDESQIRAVVGGTIDGSKGGGESRQ